MHRFVKKRNFSSVCHIQSNCLLPRCPLKKKQLKFILETNDGTKLTAEQDIAFQSNLIKNMVKDLGIEDPDSSLLQEPLPVSNVDGWTLRKIVAWCSDHRTQVYKSKDEHEVPRIKLSKADEDFLNMRSENLLAVLVGANYLDIQGLMDVITQKIANFAIGKSVEELRVLYGLDNDFTLDEAEELRKRFEWIEQ